MNIIYITIKINLIKNFTLYNETKYTYLLLNYDTN